MEKQLFKDKESLKYFFEGMSNAYHICSDRVISEIECPTVVVYSIHYSDNGKDYLHYETVGLVDFKEES